MNIRNRWLSFYHPSTTVFVDDKKGFLTALKYKLSHLQAIFFNNPTQALINIKNNRQSEYENLLNVFEIDVQLTELDDQNATDAFVGLQLGNICNIACNLQRFNTQSVVVVDYMMPTLDGISFCRQLKDHPIKKIMLTASTDNSMAVKAFNEGIIDYFLFKNSPDLMQELNHAIQEMQKAYFISLIEQKLGSTMEKIVPSLNDFSIIEFYEKLIQELVAVEFYLIDRFGSMLFITYEGKPITLIISPDYIIDSYANIATDQEEAEIAEMLSSKEKLIYFPKRLDSMQPVSKWSSFLFEARPFPGRIDLFYSLIYDQELNPLRNKKIQPRKNYENP